MFSGIVTNCLPCLKVFQEDSLLRIVFSRPAHFQSTSEGDSVCVDGVCLTVENVSKNKMTFALGPETLKITKWNQKLLQNKHFNLEKALTLNQAMGGHFVTGHVDSVAKVLEYSREGETASLKVKLPSGFEKFFRKKGYIALNGVSLTVNEVANAHLSFCLIPKTLEKTNLLHLKSEDTVNFEVDYFARLFIQGFEYLKETTKKSTGVKK